jgi:hypothetical protein
MLLFFCFFIEIRGAASNSVYYGYPEQWILRYPAHRYHAVPSPGFEPTTLWLRVRHPNHSATTLHIDVGSKRLRNGRGKWVMNLTWWYKVRVINVYRILTPNISNIDNNKLPFCRPLHSLYNDRSLAQIRSQITEHDAISHNMSMSVLWLSCSGTHVV